MTSTAARFRRYLACVQNIVVPLRLDGLLLLRRMFRRIRRSVRVRISTAILPQQLLCPDHISGV